MTLFDVQQRLTVAELSTPFIKYVVWNSDMSSVALLSKHAIVIADKKLGNAQVWEGRITKGGGAGQHMLMDDGPISAEGIFLQRAGRWAMPF
jgi:hypothetical protein